MAQVAHALRAVAIVCALGFLLASAGIVAAAGLPSSYAATSWVLEGVAILAAVALFVVGSAVWLGGRRGQIGPLCLLLGAVWVSGDWVGWSAGPAGVRSVAALALPMFAPLLLHLSLAVPGGWLVGRGERVWVLAAYLLTAILSFTHALIYNPVLALGCWRTCTDNVFLVGSQPRLANVLSGALLVLALVTSLAVVIVCVARAARSAGATRRSTLVLAIPVAVAAAAQGVTALLILARPIEDPSEWEFAATYLLLGLSLVALALGLTWIEVEAVSVRRRVGRLAQDLVDAPLPGLLEEVLRSALKDPSLRVLYPLPTAEGYVDGAGHRVHLAQECGRRTAQIVRAGQTVAVLNHDADLISAAALEREIGASARLAVDNERLRAQVLAQVDDLRSSRVRVVAAGDAARQSLERNLHDGAQQRLLALSYELRLARADAQAAGDSETEARVGAASDQAQAALAELRQLAHGIYPAILAESGLAAALRSLAEDAPLPVELAHMPQAGLSAPVARAAYVLVSDTVDASARSGAHFVVVLCQVVEDALVVTVTAEGADLADGVLEGSLTRVGALGGNVVITERAVRAVIPCG